MLERKLKTRSWISGSLVARAALLLPLLCLTQVGTAVAADKKPSAAVSPRDGVTTKSGGKLTGWVTRYVPASYVILKTDTGITTIAAAEIVTVSFVDRGPEAGSEVAARILRESALPGGEPNPAVAPQP